MTDEIDYSERHDLKTEFCLNHPRKNSPIFDFPINTLVDDLVVIDYEYEHQYGGLIAIVECIHCGRIKKMSFDCLRRSCGTSHSACGQFIKTIDVRFHSIWCGLKARIYNSNY